MLKHECVSYMLSNSMVQIPDTYVLQHNSLDGYFLLRFLKIVVVICFVGCCITWPVLFPINATGGGGKRQLDLLTFGQCSSPFLCLCLANVDCSECHQ